MKNLNRLTTALAAMILMTTGAVHGQDEDPELVILDWAGYEDTGFFMGYIEQHEMVPSFSFFGEEEEAFQKLRTGFPADVSHPCSQSVSKWLEAGLLDPIQTDRIDRWDEVNSGMKEAFMFDGEYYLLPADWGTTAVAYRREDVPEDDVSSLQVFIDPAYAQQTSLPDNVDDVYALGFLATGIVDWTVATQEDFQKASAWLREAHKNVRTYWRDGAELSQLMGSGEVKISWAWNETPTTMVADGHDIGYNRSTVEGSSTWFCGYVDLADGPNDDVKVYDFFNAWMDPRSAEYLVTEWGYGHGNQAEMERLGPDILEEVGLGAVDVPLLFQSPMDQNLREQMIAEFELIKSGF